MLNNFYVFHLREFVCLFRSVRTGGVVMQVNIVFMIIFKNNQRKYKNLFLNVTLDEVVSIFMNHITQMVANNILLHYFSLKFSNTGKS